MMRSEKSCVVVPNWNLSNHRQEQVEAEERNRSSSHVHTQHNPIPMSDYEVAELTWENGQLAMHGHSGFVPTVQTKPTWTRANDTLESIVHQATWHAQNSDPTQVRDLNPASSGTKWAVSSGPTQTGPGLGKKRARPEFEQCVRDYGSSVQEDCGGGGDRSVCASASAATICRDNDTTMMTWTSFESPRSLKTKTLDDDSASLGGSENRDEEQETKGTMIHSHSTRRSRTAAIHNQSERRRRDRINQKMKALQKLVPNSSKTDKASMLDEVIEYLKQLQAQVQVMNLRNMPQMMMQQQIQMSLLARMGMGVGLGMGMGVLDMSAVARTAPPPMLHPSTVAATTPTFIPPPFAVPQMMRNPHAPPQGNPSPVAPNTSVPMSDPYCAFLAQSMNIDLYNKMAALYREQVNQTTQSTGNSSQLNHIQRK